MQPPQPMQLAAFGSGAAEIGVGIGLARRVAFRTFEDGDFGAIEGVPYPVLLGRAWRMSSAGPMMRFSVTPSMRTAVS